MAIPASATYADVQMDPGDRVEWPINFAALLQTDAGEQIHATNWGLIMSPEGAAIGVTIESGGAYAPTLLVNNQQIQIWLSVNPANQADTIFNTGIDAAITAWFETTNVPPRRYERTIVVQVINL